MSAHQLPTQLASKGAEFTLPWKGFFVPGHGYMVGMGATVDKAAATTGYGKGCTWQDTTDGKQYKNTGDQTAATWTEVT